MLIDGIRALLLTRSAITSVVGDHIQPIPAPSDLSLYPLITYQSPSDVSQNAGDGPVGVAEMRIIFDCLALDYATARKLAQVLKAILNSYSGVLPDSESTRVYLAESANLADRWEDGSQIYCTSFHALITYGD